MSVWHMYPEKLKILKSTPKGFFIAMPLIALSYILPTVAGLCSIGSWESWSTESTEGTVGYADVLTQNLGQAWGSGIYYNSNYFPVCNIQYIHNSRVKRISRNVR